jgi:hypothetical protein
VKTEDAVKFFVGLSSAGFGFIGIVAAVVVSRKEFEYILTSKHLHIPTLAFYSALFFAACVLAGCVFYLEGTLATEKGQRCPIHAARLCACLGTLGVVFLFLAACTGIFGYRSA